MTDLKDKARCVAAGSSGSAREVDIADVESVRVPSEGGVAAPERPWQERMKMLLPLLR